MRYDATRQAELSARHNLTNRLRALELAVSEQVASISAGHPPDLRDVNRRWLALDEARAIHRACQHAVDESVLREAL